MGTFYRLDKKGEKGEARIESFIEYDPDELMNGDFTPVEPLEMQIDEGVKLYDAVFFQDTCNFAISEKLCSLLREHCVSGWKGYEIHVKGIRERYHGFQVLGRCGELERPKEPGFYTGYKFDYSSWDKSDLFIPDGTTLLFCTEKVQELLRNNRITNIEWVEISKAHWYSVGTL